MGSMALVLSEEDDALLAGARGKAHQLAMRLVVAAAEVSGASGLVPIEMAHINSCHWSGRLSVDFAEFLLREGAELAVPTHTNANLIDCSWAALRPEDEAPEAVRGARRLTEIYQRLGCSSMWTCAPYQQAAGRPRFGQQIVGSESNAVGFFNSVLGARTNKYGDLVDVSAAIVGKVPLSGLHTDAGRKATHRVVLDVDERWRSDARLPHLVGVVLGQEVGTAVPVIEGLPHLEEDDLKAVAAAGATSGSVAMFHVVGQTPEAASLDTACHNDRPAAETVIDDERLDRARRSISANGSTPVTSVCIGTPHFSITEFAELRRLLGPRRVAQGMTLLVTTSRAVDKVLRQRGWRRELSDSGVTIALDTCSYYLPRPTGLGDHVMTNSAKWAYYAPGILDVDVTFGSLADCVETAVAGRLTWADR